MKLVICRGLPGSGKTTRARNWVAEDPAGRARVNRDDLRLLLHDGYVDGDTEYRQVTSARDALIESLLRKGIDVVCDDTNLPQKTARDLAMIAWKVGAEVDVWDLTDVPFEECLRRDAGRADGVGEAVIRRMRDRYLGGKTWPLPLPTRVEDEATIPEIVYTPDPGLPDAWIVDMDGTLALMGDRGPFEWDRVGEDALNESVAKIVHALIRDSYIVVMSGRDAVCRAATENWLARHAIPYDLLVMRPIGDTRKDAIVKLELFREHVEPLFHVRGVLDDRDQVVSMWRSLGLMCAQVAPGDF